MSAVEGAIETHALIAIKDMKETLGKKWNDLTDAQRVAAVRAIKRVIALEWKQRTTGEDVSEDLLFVKTTVDEFKLVSEIALYDAFWKGVNKGLEALGSFLVGAGKSLIISLYKGIDIGGLLNES